MYSSNLMLNRGEVNITQYANVYNSVEVELPVANAVEIELHEINEQAGNIKYVLMYIC